MNNIILIGMPGSGKSTLGRRLAEFLNKNFIDFDDDILEQVRKPSVWEILKDLWDEWFLDYEEQETLKLEFKNTVFSCSWSQPLREKAMNHLKKLGTVIWIDVPVEVIESRLQNMKVERIVWMGRMSLKEILLWRKNFYEKAFDYRFEYTAWWNKEAMWSDFYKFLKDNSILP